MESGGERKCRYAGDICRAASAKGNSEDKLIGQWRRRRPRAHHVIERRQAFEPAGDDFNMWQVAKVLPPGLTILVRSSDARLEFDGPIRARKDEVLNAVCPGMVNTPMAVAVTKNYDPDIVKAAVVWLCTPAASFMIGHAMAVDGGFLAQ